MNSSDDVARDAQQLVALKRANRVRVTPAQLKRRIRSAEMAAAEGFCAAGATRTR